MKRRGHSVSAALFVGAAFLLSPGLALAGGVVRAGSYPPGATAHASSSQPAPVTSIRPVRLSVSVPGMTAAQPAKEPVYATLRGPDGQTRRFLVEGGRSAIVYTNVVVRPGQSVTIRWVPAK